MPTALVRHLIDPAPAGPGPLLAADVRFSSPFADYEGRDTVAHLFSVIPTVFEGPTPLRELTGEDERATVLRGRVGAHAADAILDERYDGEGRVQEVVLLLRPLAAVTEAVRLMGVALRPARPGHSSGG